MGTSPITEVKQALIDAKQKYIDSMHAIAKRALELWKLASDPNEKRILEELRVTAVREARRAIRECEELNRSPLESTAIN